MVDVGNVKANLQCVTGVALSNMRTLEAILSSYHGIACMGTLCCMKCETLHFIPIFQLVAGRIVQSYRQLWRRLRYKVNIVFV
jgi:hypothetical protein